MTHLAENPPAPRNATTRLAYEAVRRAVMSGALPPGTPLSERQIAVRLGMSRTPVREALAMLEMEELAVLGTGGQLVVRELTVADIREIYDVRVVLEGFGARLAAEVRSDEDLRRLRAIHDELTRSFRLPEANQDVAVQTRLDAAFHKGIGAASGNRALARLMGLLVDTPIREHAFFWFTRERHLLSLRHHASVLEALGDRDAAGAEAQWRRHVQLGGESLADGLAKMLEGTRGDELWGTTLDHGLLDLAVARDRQPAKEDDRDGE